MSTLKVNTVQHNTTGFNNVVQFTDGAGTQNGTLCRAWVNFDGTGTVAIRDDFNVNTIGDNGTGDYTVNFSNGLADVNYAVSLATNEGGAGSSTNEPSILIDGNTNTLAASSFRLRVYFNAANRDSTLVMASIFR